MGGFIHGFHIVQLRVFRFLGSRDFLEGEVLRFWVWWTTPERRRVAEVDKLAGKAWLMCFILCCVVWFGVPSLGYGFRFSDPKPFTPSFRAF